MADSEPLLKAGYGAAEAPAPGPSAGQGAVLLVDSLNYATRAPKTGALTPVLHDVSFVVNPGETLYVMGRAGPWMPTLLQLCSSQRAEGVMSGAITYDGTPAKTSLRHVVTLVSKEEHFDCISTLTVREVLMCMARLRLGGDAGPAEHAARVDEVIAMLGLQKCAHVRLGSSTVRGVSGGEKKRVGIGLGLVSSPAIVVLDEPTTGLDSTTALDVMTHVQGAIARDARRSVLVGIHMPSAEVFALADKLLLVADGRVVYYGAREGAPRFFTAAPYAGECLARENPADFCLAMVAVGGTRTQLPTTDAPALAAAFAATPLSAEGRKEVQAAAASGDRAEFPPYAPTHIDRIRQVKTLGTRSLTQFARSSSIWRTSLFKMFWIGFLYSTTYAAQPLTVDGAINLQTCFYFALMFGILGNLRGIATLFDERSLYEHERTSRAYEPVVYFTVTTFAQMPWLLFMNTLFSSLVFWSIGLWKLQNAFPVYIWYLCITALTNLIGFAWAQMLAAYTSSQAVAMSVWQPGVYIWSQTSGFPINAPTISHSNPAWMLMSISFTRWAYEAIILGVFWNGWGPESQHDIFAKYGYTNTPLWAPLPFMLLFPIVVRLVTYFPLLEKKSNLEELGAGDYQGAARDALETGAGKDGASTSLAVAEDDALEGKVDGEQGGFAEATQIAVVVKNTYYSVRLVNEQGAPFVKPLLRDVSFDVQPGELCAIMGPSGAGKSTFLDWLAGRKTTGFGKADLKYNGATPTFEQRSTCEAYVMQHDVMINTLTVSETLRVACMLRLGRPTAAQVAGRVRYVLALLGLEQVASKLIGGLSSGQRRLAAVAVEIIHLPSIVYLDEPTSGLDSGMSLDFVRAIQRLAQNGRTVVCTIHQPTEEIFNMFSKLLLIGDGVARYFGTPQDAITKLYGEGASAGGRNPAEMLMDYVKRAPPPEDAGLLEAEPSAPGAFDLDASMMRGAGAGAMLECNPLEVARQQGYHFYVHLLRNLLILKNTKSQQFIALVRNIVVGLWYGIVYWQQTNYHSLASVTYFSQQFITMSNLQAIPQMFAERALFYRERAAGFYSEAPYLLARCAVNAALQVVFALVYSVLVYPMVGLRGGLFSEYFVFFYLIMFGLSLAGYAFSNFIAAITPNQQSALNLYSSFFQFFMFFCGYSIPVHQAPLGWRWATQISFARWSFESLVLNQFAGETDDDGAGGTYWLGYWGFDRATKWYAYFMFILCVAAFHLLALLMMKFVSFERR